MELRCIHCGFPIKTLFLQYSPGNIRLMKCENCKAVADEYIECESMIVLIDLILHKPKAYRHLLFNLLNPQTLNFQGLLWKSALGFLLLDAYRIMVLTRSEEEWGLSMSFSSLFWRFSKILMDVLFGNLAFLSIFLLATRNLLYTVGGASRYKNLLLAILISSYFKIFLIAMMVWELPSSVIFIIDVFVLSSNTVALKVVTGSGMSRCAETCFVAHAVKLFVGQLTVFHSSRFLQDSKILTCEMPIYSM
ncbi:hypothetical protein PVL29_020078 [Vitis rotundifolia]|uniref:Protein ARV n=2 Tax=Vitis rotundifolia TaxID=103349 RepID=A0AA38Z264_VITRO|nr:hypothetical protein PVL29_020078 [Vitis rotundifolia]